MQRGKGGYLQCRAWGRRSAGSHMVRERGRAGFFKDRKAERAGEALCPKPGVPQGVVQSLPSAGGPGAQQGGERRDTRPLSGRA